MAWAWIALLIGQLATLTALIWWHGLALAQVPDVTSDVSGLVLGWLRWISGSTILAMLLHGLLNCEGTHETLMAFQH